MTIILALQGSLISGVNFLLQKRLVIMNLKPLKTLKYQTLTFSVMLCVKDTEVRVSHQAHYGQQDCLKLIYYLDKLHHKSPSQYHLLKQSKKNNNNMNLDNDIRITGTFPYDRLHLHINGYLVFGSSAQVSLVTHYTCEEVSQSQQRSFTVIKTAA